MDLHDWIDEACDALDLEAEVDEGLVLDLARTVAQNVQRPAAPVTAFLLGMAAGRDANPEAVEALAERLTELAEAWDKPATPEDEAEIGIDDDADDVAFEEE